MNNCYFFVLFIFWNFSIFDFNNLNLIRILSICNSRKPCIPKTIYYIYDNSIIHSINSLMQDDHYFLLMFSHFLIYYLLIFLLFKRNCYQSYPQKNCESYINIGLCESNFKILIDSLVLNNNFLIINHINRLPLIYYLESEHIYISYFYIFFFLKNFYSI